MSALMPTTHPGYRSFRWDFAAFLVMATSPRGWPFGGRCDEGQCCVKIGVGHESGSGVPSPSQVWDAVPSRCTHLRAGVTAQSFGPNQLLLSKRSNRSLWDLLQFFLFVFLFFFALGVPWKTYWGMKGTLNPQSRGTSGWLQGAPWFQKRQKCPSSNKGMLWLWSPLTHLSHCSAFSGTGPLLTMSLCVWGSWEAELFRNMPQENTGLELQPRAVHSKTSHLHPTRAHTPQQPLSPMRYNTQEMLSNYKKSCHNRWWIVWWPLKG